MPACHPVDYFDRQDPYFVFLIDAQFARLLADGVLESFIGGRGRWQSVHQAT
jgi:hypothetical protein